MSLPRTGVEINGEVTSRDHEIAFLTQIAEETDATLTEAGRTVRERPIHRIDIGTGANTILFLGSQHSNEWSGREVALELIRDLAYSTDPSVTTYLASNRVVVLPSMNADGDSWRRNNYNDVNLNRDWFQLTQPETRAARTVIRDVQPTVIVDLHENGLDFPEWVGTPELAPGSHPGLSALGEGLQQHTVASVETGGYSAGRYPRNLTPVSGAAPAAGAFHAVGIISEVLRTDHSTPGNPAIPLVDRVAVSRIVVKAAWQWHGEHAAELVAARNASLHYALTSKDEIRLGVSEMFSGTTITVDAVGYQLLEPLPQYLVEAHNIVVEGSYVSLNQPARVSVAMLCDPESRDKMVSARRVVSEYPASVSSGQWVDTWVVVGGVNRRITAWKVEGGARKNIQLPVKNY